MPFSLEPNSSVPSLLTPQEYASRIPLFRVTSYIDKEPPTQLAELSKRMLIDDLQWHFDQLIERDPILRNLLLAVSDASAYAVVFGGWVRDRIVNFQLQHQIHSRDLDIVVKGLNLPQLQQLLPLHTDVTLFGGCSTVTTTTKLDIWLLENTYIFTKLSLPICFETLPKTTVFRINSVIFQPKQLWPKADIFECGCIDAIGKRIIDFQSNCVPLPYVQVARALIYSAKLKFQLEPEVFSFIQTICTGEDEVERVKHGLESYCPKQFLSDASHLFESIISS